MIPTSPDGLYHYFVAVMVHHPKGPIIGNLGHISATPLATFADLQGIEAGLTHRYGAPGSVLGVTLLSAPRPGDTPVSQRL